MAVAVVVVVEAAAASAVDLDSPHDCGLDATVKIRTQFLTILTIVVLAVLSVLVVLALAVAMPTAAVRLGLILVGRHLDRHLY